MEESLGAKRRKVRKGTQSCWECKRRKVRCIFASAEHRICNNCRRRGTTCISQELSETVLVPSTGGNQVQDRLGRVEQLIEQLVNNDPARDISKPPSTSLALDTESRPKGSPTNNTVRVPQGPNRRSVGRYEEVSRDLIAAWPCQGDLDLIRNLPVGLSTPVFWEICTPYPSFIHRGPPSPQEMLQLPPPDSHPVLIARKLLVLGTFLQGVVPASVQSLDDRGVCCRDIMTRVVDQAIRLVTTNDELIYSVEGIECIMMEVMYQNYAGNLHRAWMAVHRAIALAQMMALHRGPNSPSLKFVEPETRAAFDPDHICFRLVQMDRYLSIMLGLPHTSLEARFAIPTASEGGGVDRMERFHCAVAERILQRNNADVNNLSKTRDIDKLLQTAAAEMPPQWWLNPTFATEADLLSDTVRLMQQLTHYHLLARLHMPYMLRWSPDNRLDHSKITAVNASREILSRYIVFRTSNPAHFYCRGCDFLAFVATTIMCLAHITSSSHSQGDHTIFSSLAHSRPSDRGIMERTSETIESMARARVADAIAPKLTRIIHHLLDVEASAATGTIYSTSSSDCDEGEFDGNVTHGGKALHVHIPYFGTITFERGIISKSAPSQLDVPVDTLLSNQLIEPHDEHLRTPTSLLSSQIGDQPCLDLNTDVFQLDSDPASAGNTTPPIQIPDLMLTGTDDWDLQGIDIALFDSLFRGIDIPAEDAWMSS